MRAGAMLHGLAGLGLCLANPLWALSFHATLDPIELTAKPGESATRQFQLTLKEGEPTTHFRSHVQDFYRSEDQRQSFYLEPGDPDSPSRSCARWVSLAPVEATVQAGETMVVRQTITVPGDATPGGYWCVLTVDEVPDPLTNPPGVGIRFLASMSVGIFVYVPPVERRARILSIQIGPQQAQLRIENDGNCPLRAVGRFEFLKPGTEAPTAVAVIPRTAVFPEPIKTAILTADLPDAAALPSGRYVVRAILDIGLKHYIGAKNEVDIIREEGQGAAPGAGR